MQSSFFFFFSSGCLFASWSLSFVMVCFFLVVLGAKIGVVVCLVGAFLVVLAQFEMSLHHLISENNSCISYAATKIDGDPLVKHL